MNIALEDTMNKNLIFCVRLVVSVRMCVLRTATASSTSVWVGGAFQEMIILELKLSSVSPVRIEHTRLI